MLEPIKRLDLHGTLYTDAQFQLVVGAGIAAAIAALFHWSSKIAGSQGLDALGLGAAGLTLLGTLAIAVGDIASVIGGSEAKHVNGTQTFNLLCVLGAAAVTGAVLLTADRAAPRGTQRPGRGHRAGRLGRRTDARVGNGLPAELRGLRGHPRGPLGGAVARRRVATEPRRWPREY